MELLSLGLYVLAVFMCSYALCAEIMKWNERRDKERDERKANEGKRETPAEPPEKK